VKRAFLGRANLGAARREPLPADASTRAYERLHVGPGRTLMLMDAPPSAESSPCPPEATPEQRRAAGYNAMARLSAGRLDAFVACSAYLRGRGLAAPKVLAVDARIGLAVLEDLGDDLFARLLERGAAEEAELYGAAVDALLRLQEKEPPEALPTNHGQWPLLVYDDLALKTGADLFVEWMPRLAAMPPLDAAALEEWDALWAPVRARAEAGASVFAHRDYHAENLIWLPERAGPARVGLLDFQDAVRAHPAWDLLSLLQDARRDVSPELEQAMLDRYLAARPGLQRDGFMADYSALAALNNTRILGIFARLIVRDGKPRYGRFTRRVWRHLERDLEAPGMEGLRRWFQVHVPVNTREAA
jgi:hypothetical protein